MTKGAIVCQLLFGGRVMMKKLRARRVGLLSIGVLLIGVLGAGGGKTFSLAFRPSSER